MGATRINSTDRKKIITETINSRINSWYEDVKILFDVDGKGECKFLPPKEPVKNEIVMHDFVLTYEENDRKFVSTYAVSDEDIFRNNLSWLFDIWAEGSMPTMESGGQHLSRDQILSLYS